MGKGRGSVRRRRAAAARMAAAIPLAVSLQGYRYCDLLLSQGRAAEARDRAAQTMELRGGKLGSRRRARHFDPRPRPSRPGVAEPGGRRLRPKPARDDARAAAARLDEAVEGLRASGEMTMSLAACSPAPPSAAPSATGTARRATSTKSQEIAEPGPMRLFSAIARSSARGLRSRAAKPSRR